MIKFLPFSKATIKKYKNVTELRPILQNSNDYVKIDDDIAQKPKEVINSVKDMVANYAKHENVSINFKRTVIMDDKHLIGSSAANAITEITKNSVNIEVNPLNIKLKEQLNTIRATLKSEDFSENVKTIYTKLYEIVQRVKAK